MKKQIVLVILFCSAHYTFSQLIDANFNGGIPAGWSTSSELDFEWETQYDLGTDGSNCLWVDMGGEGSAAQVYLELPNVDLTAVIEPEIVFSLVITKNNFITPDLWLCYDSGEGWERIVGWGDGFGEAEMIIPTGFDPFVPLSEENITWNANISYDLAAFADEETIRFAFEASVHNGGWVLLDDVFVGSALFSGGVNEDHYFQENYLFPNPTNGLLYIQSKDILIEEIMIFDVLGQEVAQFQMQDNMSEISFDLTDYQKGIYLVSIIDSQNGRHIERLVIE